MLNEESISCSKAEVNHKDDSEKEESVSFTNENEDDVEQRSYTDLFCCFSLS